MAPPDPAIGQATGILIKRFDLERDPPTIVVLTTIDQNDYIYRALRAGAAGFLLKDASSFRLIEPSITPRLVERFAGPEVSTGVPAQLARLTERASSTCSALITRCLSNAEIATGMVVAERTVKTHVARILNKLSVRDRVQPVVVTYETGFVGPQRCLNPGVDRARTVLAVAALTE